MGVFYVRPPLRTEYLKALCEDVDAEVESFLWFTHHNRFVHLDVFTTGRRQGAHLAVDADGQVSEQRLVVGVMSV